MNSNNKANYESELEIIDEIVDIMLENLRSQYPEAVYLFTRNEFWENDKKIPAQDIRNAFPDDEYPLSSLEKIAGWRTALLEKTTTNTTYQKPLNK
jgi:hypothetical protein